MPPSVIPLPPVRDCLLSLLSGYSSDRCTSDVGGARTGVETLLASQGPPIDAFSASNELHTEIAACPPHLWTLHTLAFVQPYNLVRAFLSSLHPTFAM